MDAPIITLTTDFGTSDHYVAVMKGVILRINPEVHLVDLSHDVQPQDIRQAAFLIGSSYRYFPPETVHVVVVDPGVGTSRRALLLVTPSARFVVPDNGILSYILMEGLGDQVSEVGPDSRVALPQSYKAYHLTNPKYWLQPVSSTFHGRDIFAPVAAHLSFGVAPQELGEEVGEAILSPVRQPRWKGDTLEGHVVHVDRFGNLITDVAADLLPTNGKVEIQIKVHRISGVSNSYAEGEHLVAVLGSHGNLGFSARGGNAAHALGVSIRDSLKIGIRA